VGAERVPHSKPYMGKGPFLEGAVPVKLVVHRGGGGVWSGLQP
jgi:hypothetical protein